MANYQANVKWKNFETQAGLDADSEYNLLTKFNYDLICKKLPAGSVCTNFTNKFLTDFKIDLKNYRVGAILIGPEYQTDNLSYSHEAIGIAAKNSNGIVAVFDPVQSAPIVGQWAIDCSHANDRFPLVEWLYKKTHWYSSLLSDSTAPFCIFQLKSEYFHSSRYSWVVNPSLSVKAEKARRSVVNSGPKY